MDSPLLDKLKRAWPTERWGNMTIVVGCSGGADSTALLLAIGQLKPADTTLIVAHFNHRLRGAESDEDECFVAELAKRMECQFVGRLEDQRTYRSNSPIWKSGRSEDEVRDSGSKRTHASEAMLRELRYAFLQKVAQLHGARYVAVAHTADDCVETTLHNLARGTGLVGLTGIAPYRDLNSDLVLIRPLIEVWRKEVLEYLAQERQSFRIDSSNQSHAYTRNRIRHRWLPMLEEDLGCDPRPAIYRSSSILAELQVWLQIQAREWLDRSVIYRSPHRIELRVSQPVGSEWPVVQHALTMLWQQQSWPLMAMTHGHWSRLRGLFRSPASQADAIELPSNIRVSRSADRCLFEMGNR
jgi:tRNA(Ile)-lysidine synthase